MKIEKDIIYNAARPDDCRLDVYLPETGAYDRAFVYFHGGGIEGGDKIDFGQHAQLLTDGGTAVVSANYRMYPQAKFPDFIEDAAAAVAWTQRHLPGAVYVGGSSAGAYLSMMLYFDRRYLAEAGADADEIAGWAFDAGQPTTHYNVLRERGLDTRLVRVDEAAPVFFADEARFARVRPEKDFPRILILCADDDMPGRLEQNRLLAKTMEVFGFPAEKIDFRLMEGFTHCAYDGLPLFGEILRGFLAD